MEEEKDARILLAEYAQKKGYDYATNSNFKRLISVTDSFLSKKFFLFEIEKGFWFFAADSFAGKAGSGSTFTGIYTTINMDPSFSCKIHIKETLDGIFRWNRKKTGNPEIDRQLTITTNQKSLPDNIIREGDIYEFRKIYDKVRPSYIVFQNDYLPDLPALNGKMILGIETNYWVYLDDQLDVLIDKGLPLLKKICSAHI